VGAAIVVAHAIVALGYHVVVEVGQNVVGLGDLKSAGVVLGAQQPVLLGSPPGEADLVSEAVLLQVLEDLEQESCSGGVVAERVIVLVCEGSFFRSFSEDTYLMPGPAWTESR
jgi:deoxycytidylate deaminase